MIPNKTSLNIENLPVRASNVENSIKELWGGEKSMDSMLQFILERARRKIMWILSRAAKLEESHNML